MIRALLNQQRERNDGQITPSIISHKIETGTILPGVLHLIDTLEAGGGERVAVNLANLMSRSKYRSYLCVTRREGPLADLVAPDVERICLRRKRSFDLAGLRQL